MATLFASAFGDTLLSLRYHFAIMFKALFILTTLYAGTRVARFMLQDLLGCWVPTLGRTSWYPGLILTSGVVVTGWGWLHYTGVIDPLGGINRWCQLFGIANQMLAGIVLCMATTLIVKSGKLRYAWVTGDPLARLLINHQQRRLSEAVLPGAADQLPHPCARPVRQAGRRDAAGGAGLQGAATHLQRFSGRRADGAVHHRIVVPGLRDPARLRRHRNQAPASAVYGSGAHPQPDGG